MFFFFSVISVAASTTDGTIDATDKYAWGEGIGWVNFGTGSPGGNVHVTDSALTGSAWSANYGWIVLNPSSSGVTNNAEGVLGGYGWGENLGYISFSGVQINSSGVFSGTASTSFSGLINFNCSGCTVRTDWRPASTRGGGGGGGGSGGGGGPLPDYSEKPHLPLGVLINRGEIYTTSPNVTLNFFTGDNVATMQVSNSPTLAGSFREVLLNQKLWNLCSPTGAGTGDCPEGTYTVFVKYFTRYNQESGIYFDTIVYKKSLTPAEEEHNKPPIPPLPPTPSVPEVIKDILNRFLPEILKFKTTQRPDFPIKIVPREAPLVLSGLPWELLPRPAIERYVFSPLSQRIVALQAQFPRVGQLFRSVGIARNIDLPKLRGVNLILPGLTGALSVPRPGLSTGPLSSSTLARPDIPVGTFSSTSVPRPDLSTGAFSSSSIGIPQQLVAPGLQNYFGPLVTPRPFLTPGTFAVAPRIPVAKLDIKVKEQIPKEVVFARAAGETIDLDAAVSLDSEGKLRQSISTVSGSVLDLFIKPIAPANSVKGLMVLRSRTHSDSTAHPGILMSSLFDSFFSRPPNALFTRLPAGANFADILTAMSESVRELERRGVIESGDEKFVLQQFQYQDTDGDGIYSAQVHAPVVDGEYDIITLISYKDPELGNRQLALTAVVDPEGYVYEQTASNRQTRIAGVTVTLYQLNPGTGQYDVWPASDYDQENPQVTGDRGTYAFLTPPGTYKISATADGFVDYQTKSFDVRPGDSGIHLNIPLVGRRSWFANFDYRTVLLALVIILLLLHFYMDRRRDRRRQNTPAI